MDREQDVSTVGGQARREDLLAAIPDSYSGVAHFSLIQGAGVALLIVLLQGGSPLGASDARWVLGFFVFANGVEWWVHRGPMHHLTPFLEMLFERHTLMHHAAFTDSTMAISEARELRLVLFPWWAFPLMLLLVSPVPILLWLAVSHDLARLFLACAIAYYLAYELLHTFHHLPESSWIGRRSLVRKLAAHHRRHHDRGRMTRGNFNVSFPLWDYVLGSTLSERSTDEAGSHESSGPSAPWTP